MKPYLKQTEFVYLGEFYLRDKTTYSWKLVPIYICNKDWYNLVITEGLGKKRVKYESLYKVCIPFEKHVACGVPKIGYKYTSTGQYSFEDFQIFKRIYPFSETESDYIFLTNDNNITTYYRA